jgi:hypothetical protein
MRLLRNGITAGGDIVTTTRTIVLVQGQRDCGLGLIPNR